MDSHLQGHLFIRGDPPLNPPLEEEQASPAWYLVSELDWCGEGFICGGFFWLWATSPVVFPQWQSALNEIAILHLWSKSANFSSFGEAFYLNLQNLSKLLLLFKVYYIPNKLLIQSWSDVLSLLFSLQWTVFLNRLSVFNLHFQMCWHEVFLQFPSYPFNNRVCGNILSFMLNTDHSFFLFPWSCWVSIYKFS